MKEDAQDIAEVIRGWVVFIDVDQYLCRAGYRPTREELALLTSIWSSAARLSTTHGLRLIRTFGDALLLHLPQSDEERLLAICSFLVALREELKTSGLEFKAVAVLGPYCVVNGKHPSVPGSPSLVGPAGNMAGKLIARCPRGTFVYSSRTSDLPVAEISFDSLWAVGKPHLQQIPLACLTGEGNVLSEGLPYTPPPENSILETCSSDPQAYSQFSNQAKYHIIEMLKLADDKAKVVFGLSAALLVYLFNRDPSPALVRQVFFPATQLDLGLLVLQAAGAIGLLASCMFALRVIIPRTGTTYRGLIFFGSIAAWSNNSEYADQVLNRSPLALERENAKHNHDMASVVATKYRALRACILSMSVGLAFTLTAFAIEKVFQIALKI